MQGRELADKVFKQVADCFIYKTDIENYGAAERWDHHADAVEAGEDFYDDCDGFAITCAELLLRQGAKPEDVLLIVCTIRGEGHMVCGLETGETTWILDNNSNGVRDWGYFSNYNWRYAMRLNEKGKWRRVK